MAFSQAELDALVTAYFSRVRRGSYDGKTFEYQSLEDLAKAISTGAAALGITNPLAPAANLAGLPRHSLAVLRGRG